MNGSSFGQMAGSRDRFVSFQGGWGGRGVREGVGGRGGGGTVERNQNAETNETLETNGTKLSHLPNRQAHTRTDQSSQPTFDRVVRMGTITSPKLTRISR